MATEQKNNFKGEFGGECNRSACTRKYAYLYNHSTRKYYCIECARQINEANRDDSMRLYGHELCTQPSNDPAVTRLIHAVKKQQDFLLWLDFSKLGKLGQDWASELLAEADNILADHGIQ
jgi:hypothetical protein